MPGAEVGRAVVTLETKDNLKPGLDKGESRVRAWGARVGDIAKVAILGIGAVGLGIAAAGVKAAAESQKVSAQTAAVLKSTGGAAGLSQKAVEDLADSLSRVTPFEDEAIQAGENMLLTFTSIGKDVFPLATETILDMSTALGQDLQGSAIQLGKALNDPIRGITALRRVGVQFTDKQEEMIASLVKAGKLEQAQRLILKELQVEFGGSARAAGQTFAGKLAILQTQIGNVAEKIGGALIPMLSGFLDAAMPIIDVLGEKLPRVFAVLGEMFDVITGRAPDAGGALSEIVGHDVASYIMTGLATIREAFRGAFAIISAIIGAFQGRGMQPVVDAVRDASSKIGPLLGAMAGQVGAWAGAAAQQLLANAPQILAAIGTAITDLLDFVGDHSEEVGEKIGEFIPIAAQYLIDNLPTLIVAFATWLKNDALPALGRIGFNFAKGLAEGIWKGLQQIGPWLFAKLTEWATSAIPEPLRWALGLSASPVGALAPAAGPTGGAMAATLGGGTNVGGITVAPQLTLNYEGGSSAGAGQLAGDVVDITTVRLGQELRRLGMV